MAVNDLMMRIQLLVDSGRSSAELNRIQKSLADLNKSLKSLENTKISVLSNSLESLKSAASGLRSVNLQNFTRTIDEVKKSFSGLGATTQGLDNLKTAFQQLSQQANANSLKQYQSDLKNVTARLREAKQLTLTSAGASSNPNYLQLTSDLARYNQSLILSTKEIVDQRREVLRLKNDLSSISKVKFDSNLVLELSKLNNNRNLRNQPFSVIDRTTIGNLQDYNSKLSENQKALLVASSKAEGYRQTLAKLRLEAQGKAIPDLTVGGTRNLVTELNAAQSAVAQLRTSGIIPLENSIRSLQAKASFDKAFNIDPAKARVKVLRAEIAQLRYESSNFLKLGGLKSDQAYDDYLSKINEKYKKIVDENIKIAQAEQRAQQTTARGIAHINQRLAAKKNELALDKNQEQSIKSLIAQQKQSAQLAAQAVKTRTGGIFDTTKSNNNIKSEANLYKQNLQALKQYLSERKAAAQVDIDAAKSQLYSAQVILAQKQLTKAEYAAERAEIKANMAIEKEKSRVYQEGLRANQQSLRESITAEREKTRSLLADIRNARQLATEEGNIVKIRLQQELLQSRKGRSDLREQIKQTEDLTRVELNRLAVIERIANSSSRSSANQNVGFAIKETQRIIDETTKRLGDLAVKSEAAKAKLAQIGAGLDLPTLNAKIKETVADLKSLKQAGGVGTITYANMDSQLAGLREQRALLRQIASIDLKNASGQVELKGLQQTINQLREAQREMSRLGQFTQGFKQGFSFALQPDQLGMAAFNTLQQVLSELGRKFIEVNSQAETLIRGLSAVFGAGQGEVQFEKLISLANTYGLSLHDLSRNYLSLNSSSKGTILEGQESEKIFRSLSAAMAVLGADTITTQRAFRAVSQMISKGQVYAEELKGQLAEALPGAIQIFARSMGKTSQEFLAMVKAGNVGLNELIPFFQQIEKEYGAAATASTTYEQATNRLSNAWTVLLKNIGDTGVWKLVVSAISGLGSYVQGYADLIEEVFGDKFKKSIGNKLNELSEELFNLKPIVIPTKLEFDNLQGTVIGDKEYKIVGKFIFENYEDAKAKLESINQSRKDRIELIEEEQKKLEAAGRSNTLEAQDKRLIELNKEIEASYRGIEEAKKLIVKDRPSAALAILGVTPSISFNEKEAKDKIDAIYKRIAALMEDLNKKTAERNKLKLQVDEDNKNSQIDEQKLKLTKQQINATKVLLNTQQQGQLALYAVESQRAALSLKASGSSSAVIAEVKAALALKNTYTELAKAKQIEANIKTGQKNEKDNSTVDQIKLIRELTVDQLKYALTVARTSNNYAATLAILQELNRVQNDLANETASNPLAGFKDASAETLKTLGGIIDKLKGIANEGNLAAGQIYKMLALVEQQNNIKTIKSVSKDKNDLEDLKREIEYNELNVKAADKNNERKREKIVLSNASLALAKAEEVFNKMKRANNETELAQLREILNESISIGKSQARSATNRKAKPLFEQFKALEEQVVKFQRQADAVNLSAMTDGVKELALELGAVKNASGKFDFTTVFASLESGVKTAVTEYTNLKTLLAGMDKASPDFAVTKAAMEDAARKATNLSDGLDRARSVYQDFAKVGKVDKIEFKPIIEPSAKAEIEQYRTDLLGKPISMTVDIKNDEVKAKANEARKIVEGIMQPPINMSFNFNTPDNKSGFIPTSLQQQYQQTIQLKVSGQEELNKALASLAKLEEQSGKKVDIQIAANKDGSFDIKVTPKVDQTALNEASNLIKTTFTTVSEAKVAPTVDLVAKQNVVTEVKKLSSEVGAELKPGYYSIEMKDSGGNVINSVKSTMDEAQKTLDDNKGKYSISWSSSEFQRDMNEKVKSTQQLEVPLFVDEATSKANFQATKAQLDAEFQAQPTKIILDSNAQEVYGEVSGALSALQSSDATKIHVAFDETTGKVTITADDSNAKSTVSSLIDEINARSATLKVNVVYTESGSKPKGYRSGGLLGGYGGGDRIHALLEPGEFIFNKEAVRAIGIGQLTKMNRAGKNIEIPRTSSINQLSIPRFANGGPVAAMTTVNFNFGSAGKFSLSGSRDQVNGITKALSQIARTL